MYKPQRLIITCRVRSYEGETVFGDYPVYTLASFDDQKIHKFTRAWYNAQKSLGRVDAQQAQHRAENLAEAALSEELHELATNPMILTTMALIHQREVGLPKERVRLFSLAVEILLRRWQQGKTGEASLANHPALTALLNDNRRLRSVVEKLAYDMHSTGTAMARGDALTILEQSMYLGDVGLAAAFLDYVDQRAGLLVGIGGDPDQPTFYSFPHRTFQEYLAGCHLLSLRDTARMIFSHAGEGDTWSLVVRLTAEELIYNRRRDYELIDLAIDFHKLNCKIDNTLGQ
jgi:predicted NACHT family NTPase